MRDAGKFEAAEWYFAVMKNECEEWRKRSSKNFLIYKIWEQLGCTLSKTNDKR